jgi:hypothetical protein
MRASVAVSNLLPSGEGDGYGIAVHPDNMLAMDYGRIVGVAWEDGNPKQYVSVIKTVF